MIFIDTNIAMDARDKDEPTLARIMALDVTPSLATMTWIELEQGVHRDPDQVATRRRLLDRLLLTMKPILFTEADINVYGAIVAALGFNRPRAADRLIAAQAMARSAPLITRNPRDFREIEGLRLIEW